MRVGRTQPERGGRPARRSRRDALLAIGESQEDAGTEAIATRPDSIGSRLGSGDGAGNDIRFLACINWQDSIVGRGCPSRGVGINRRSDESSALEETQD